MIAPGHPRSIGKHVPRREDPYLLRGEGRFLDDIAEPKDTLFLSFVMSPHAHARIIGIDISAAQAFPGVVGVFTAADMSHLAKPLQVTIDIPGYHNNARAVLAEDRVRFVGEQVAVVVAEDPYIAQDAIELVTVEYEPLPATVVLEEADASAAPLVHDHIASNAIFEGNFASKGFEAAFKSCDLVLRERFRTGRVAGVPLEPRGCLALLDHVADSLVFYTSTQVPHLVRTALAEVLDMPEPRIRVVTPEVGGGFGTKAQIYTEEVVVAALAMHLRRPIKWVQDRREELLTSIHARDHIYDLEAAVEPDGKIKALRIDLTTNAGAYSSYPFGCTLEATGGARMIIGPYDIQNYAYRTRALATHTCPSGAYRGVAQPSCFMAIEGMMDRIGRHLGLDPALVRQRNVIRRSQIPYTNVLGVTYDSGSHEECLIKALELSDYWAFRQEQAAAREDDEVLRGIGICCYTEVSGAGSAGWRVRGLSKVPGFDSATIKIEPTGQVTLLTSQAAAGQGHLTTFAQVLSDYLGARVDEIFVSEGDTANAPYGTNTFASRSAVAAGGAVIKAAQSLRQKVVRIAAYLLDVDPDRIELRNSEAVVTDDSERSVSFRQIAEVAYSMSLVALPQGEAFGLEVVEMYDPPLATWPNGVHVVQVSVDRRTAAVTIDKYVVVHDCGVLINPMIVNGQIHGGTVQGIGEALMEQIVYDSEGQMLNANLLDYLLPTAEDAPDIVIDHVETPSVDALGGFKGVGEGGVVGAVPAVVNAVADALTKVGANINTLPLRPSYLLQAMRERAQGLGQSEGVARSHL